MKIFTLTLIISICSTFAHATSRDMLEFKGEKRSPVTIQKRLNKNALSWCERNIVGFTQLDRDKQGSILVMVDAFYSRLSNWQRYNDDYRIIYSRDLSKDLMFTNFLKDSPGVLNFEILPAHMGLTDNTYYESLRGKTVEQVFGYEGDHRLMENVRADGSRQSVVINEKDQIPYIKGKWNIFYHEFAHFIHFTLLSHKEFMALSNLYKRRQAQNDFMDDYAATNASEYFAQGFEAYFSDTKYGETHVYYKHTKEDLLKSDPVLYRFLESLL